MLGLNSGRETHGHRFEAAIDPVIFANADEYAAKLATDGAVIASFAERRAEIARQLDAAAAKAGGKPIDDDALLDEVTALVERPNVLIGQFEQEFLAVPQECLILTMKANQKYFPLLDTTGKLTNKFLVVSNISPEDASAVIGGNERVVRPRLADAKVLLRPGPQKIAGIPRHWPVQGRLSHTSWAPRASACSALPRLPVPLARRLGGEALALHAEQAAVLAKADPADRHCW